MGEYEIGIYGLGVMGKSLAKNCINQGFLTALYSKAEKEREDFSHDTGNFKVFPSEEVFIKSLKTPRIVFLMVTAGKPVDLVVEAILPYLEKGDVIIDGGNSYFPDTNQRVEYLSDKGINFLGVGVSGGERGALTGPSMMVGGSQEGWKIAGHILQKMAAKAENESCCGYVGSQGAGHYVKMVHNGIEYAILQLIADTYYIMNKGMGMSHEKIQDVFKGFQGTELDGYLIDITIKVLEKKDEDGQPLVGKILDVAKQKGTGSWTLIEGVERGIYIPTICEAVFERNFSQHRAMREEGAKTLSYPEDKMVLKEPVKVLKEALYTAIICAYAQGVELISKASQDFGWNIDMAKTVALWRNGCIIRSKLLKNITTVLEKEPEKKNLLLSEGFAFVGALVPSLREVVIKAQMVGLAVPALVSTLNYYDCYHSSKLPLNIVQGLRDCFGAHTYERVDKVGCFHTQWEEDSNS